MEAENALVSRPKQWVSSTKEFWRDTSAEMKKVTWPSRLEVMNTTIVTTVTTLVFAVFLWGCDQLFSQGMVWLLKRFGASV